MSQIIRFEIGYTQYVNHMSEIVQDLPKFAHDSTHLLSLYRMMVLTRLFDQKAISLQRTGKLGTYASSLGQEAIGVAIGDVMHPEDVLLPPYREYGAQLQRGVTISNILLYWGGDERGMCFSNANHDFPICVTIASNAPHAVGVGYAMKYHNEDRVAVCVLGDGGTSKGDFYEAINAAGVWQLPIVFVISNNQWAISVPRSKQTNAQTLAQKAIAAGIYGEQVDGNDVIALRERLSVALEKARNGNGPSIIEALTYRMSDHTTADDATHYRSQHEVDEQLKYDPIDRTRTLLMSMHNWSSEQDKKLHDDCEQIVEDEVQKYLSTPPQPVESIFDYLYAELPKELIKQRQKAIQGETN